MNRRIPDPEAFEASVSDMPSFGRAECPPARILQAAGQEVLPAHLQSRVSEHISVCSSCRTLQADLADLETAQDASPREVDRMLARVRREGAAPRAHGWMFSWRAAAVAAGLVLCAVVAFRQLSTHAPPTERVQSSPSVPQPVPAPQIPDALKLEKPPVKLALSALTWRSESDGREKFLQDIAPALDLFRADRFTEASSQLETLSSSYQDSVEVFFYLGVSRLMLADYAGACSALEDARRLADDSFSADISWYLALGYQRLGRETEALALLSELCRLEIDYQERACAAMNELTRASSARSQ